MTSNFLFTIIFVICFPVSSYAYTPLEELGKKLFFEVKLSGSNTMSCASCHQPHLGWTDDLPRAKGWNGQTLTRRTPSLYGVFDANNLGRSFFWDGRSSTLEEQALAPIASPSEMNQNLHTLCKELNEDTNYKKDFLRVFKSDEITLEYIAKALAAFQLTLKPKTTRFDIWMDYTHPQTENILSKEAQAGFYLFMNRNCSSCHNPPTFTNGRFFDLGLPGEDKGVGALNLRNYKGDKKNLTSVTSHFAFKTPSLWGVGQRQYFMHNGSLKGIDAVIDFYSEGGFRNPNTGEIIDRPSKSSIITPQNFTIIEKQQLKAFLVEALEVNPSL